MSGVSIQTSTIKEYFVYTALSHVRKVKKECRLGCMWNETIGNLAKNLFKKMYKAKKNKMLKCQYLPFSLVQHQYNMMLLTILIARRSCKKGSCDVW